MYTFFLVFVGLFDVARNSGFLRYAQPYQYMGILEPLNMVVRGRDRVTPGAPVQPSNSLFLPSSRGSEGNEFECAGVVAEGESEGGGRTTVAESGDVQAVVRGDEGVRQTAVYCR
jgi:hypothetical protein